MNNGESIRDLPPRTGSSIDDNRSPSSAASNRMPHNTAVVRTRRESPCFTKVRASAPEARGYS